MANFEINEDQAALIRELRKLETSDPVHANVYNALFDKLINNDAFLERLANKMIEKSMLCHVLDSVNAQQVLAADVGPKITAIILCAFYVLSICYPERKYCWISSRERESLSNYIRLCLRCYRPKMGAYSDRQ